MQQIRISATARSKADPARVFAILNDPPGWPSWSIFDAVELNRPGRDAPHGVGSIRTFVTKVSRAREEVVELIPDRRLTYVLLAGFPLRDYKAVVEIEPEFGRREPHHLERGLLFQIFRRRLVLVGAARSDAGNHVEETGGGGRGSVGAPRGGAAGVAAARAESQGCQPE